MDYQNIFNRDFFPTPRGVFDLMTQGEPLTDAVVLEPSAGSGNIVRYCKEQGARYVKACEINDTLRNSLYNECCVIGSDFLGVNREQVADVTHIIMNPPFSSVEKHILHAWEIAPDGCTIISLCPSSRFVSRYGDAKQLTEVIDLYGSREELGNVFNVPTADRRTNANISVINESDFASVDGALRLATCLRELSEWLYQEHREILFPEKEQARRSLGERIKRLRTEQGFTQEQLAERVGITKSNICNIEAGKYSVGFDILNKIATALGTKLELNKYE